MSCSSFLALLLLTCGFVQRAEAAREMRSVRTGLSAEVDAQAVTVDAPANARAEKMKVGMAYIKVEARDMQDEATNQEKLNKLEPIIRRAISNYELGGILLGELQHGLQLLVDDMLSRLWQEYNLKTYKVWGQPGKSMEIMYGFFFYSDAWKICKDRHGGSVFKYLSQQKDHSTKGVMSMSFDRRSKTDPRRVTLVLADLGTYKNQKQKEVEALQQHLEMEKRSYKRKTKGKYAAFILGDLNCRICLDKTELAWYAGKAETTDIQRPIAMLQNLTVLDNLAGTPPPPLPPPLPPAPATWLNLEGMLKAVPWQSLDQLHCKQTAVKRAVEPINRYFSFNDGGGNWTYKRWCHGGSANSYADLFNGCQACKKLKGCNPDKWCKTRKEDGGLTCLQLGVIDRMGAWNSNEFGAVSKVEVLSPNEWCFGDHAAVVGEADLGKMQRPCTQK